jgi:hypothetical protein
VSEPDQGYRPGDLAHAVNLVPMRFGKSFESATPTLPCVIGLRLVEFEGFCCLFCVSSAIRVEDGSDTGRGYTRRCGAMEAVEAPPLFTAARFRPVLPLGWGLQIAETGPADAAFTVSAVEQDCDVPSDMAILSDDCSSEVRSSRSGFVCHSFIVRTRWSEPKHMAPDEYMLRIRTSEKNYDQLLIMLDDRISR